MARISLDECEASRGMGRANWIDCLESQGYGGAYARKRIETSDGAFGLAAGCAYAEGFISARAETHYYLPLTEHAIQRARASDHENMQRYSYRIRAN